MDYEKLYKDALERAKKQRADYQKELDKTDKNSQLAGLLRAGISAIDMTFPELAESEDERIREGLIEALKTSKTVGELKFTLPEPTKEECITYLEKQKEQKHPNGCFTCDEYKKGYEEGRRNGFTAGYNKAMKEVEQKEQKPAEKQDYSGLNDLERAIHRGFLSAGVENVPVTTIKETAKECLAQIKTAEWDEEDREIAQNIMVFLKEPTTAELCPQLRKECQDWLKSLRSRPKSSDNWKPTEEQKEALEYVIRDYREDGCNATANYLQEILDHLKNM